jgi:hypothetical protein
MRAPRGVQSLYSPQAKLRRSEVGSLVKKLVRITKRYKLTKNQQEILTLILLGYTQEEVGVKLGIHQTSVHKALFGNLVYSGKYAGRRYGGIFAKLKKIGEKEVAAYEIWDKLKQMFHNPATT